MFGCGSFENESKYVQCTNFNLDNPNSIEYNYVKLIAFATDDRKNWSAPNAHAHVPNNQHRANIGSGPVQAVTASWGGAKLRPQPSTSQHSAAVDPTTNDQLRSKLSS